MPNEETEFNELCIELFKVFSRFEYALKASGFYKGTREIQADWSAFANAIKIEDVLEGDHLNELKNSIDYILDQPPKKQVMRDNVLVWETSRPTHASKIDLVLLYVRRVRNNLFHGGKFYDQWFPPERDIRLLRCSVAILKACLNSSNAVRNKYLGG